ncbi:F0F1 ATP synthase subunit delta [Alysiella crassa]|uniref:ATP synthase subunit delta n=1 Tax=Alysiella crassa TaxID=153491 RepID=A0A376BUQ0_9NEIS|nr:F0F1 ATP synthase subunit delta [Alysiella crassa]UOP06256.1 F0F1 ATP synthase subunit delta [Alysiella crassa]SSY80742.1 F-type ATPase subunit delta [Alysiella crassa]
MIEFATVARPYAKALFELAEQKKQIETWLNGLAELAWLMQQPKVVTLLEQADLSATQKADDLIQLMADSKAMQDVEFKNFLHVVAQEKRLVALPEIYAQYKTLVLSRNNTKQAVIYTAFDIAGEGQRAKIISDLEQHFNTRLQATFKTQPDLIGGVKVEVGDQVLDLSVQGKLKALYATMTN